MTIRNHEAKYTAEFRNERQGRSCLRLREKTEVLMRNCSACIKRDEQGRRWEGKENGCVPPPRLAWNLSFPFSLPPCRPLKRESMGWAALKCLTFSSRAFSVHAEPEPISSVTAPPPTPQPPLLASPPCGGREARPWGAAPRRPGGLSGEPEQGWGCCRAQSDPESEPRPHLPSREARLSDS